MKTQEILQINYDQSQDRLTWNGFDIHCGNRLDVLFPDGLGGGVWKTVSFECNDNGWYIPYYPNVNPIGLWARNVG